MRFRMSLWTIGVIVLLGLVALGLYRHTRPAAQANTTPERKVQGQVLTSQRAPASTLEFDKAFHYVGAQRFTLFGIADAEQHIFVDADKDKTIQRAYWVQYEAYLPTSRASYDYSQDREVTVQEVPFHERVWRSSLRRTPEPDSDGFKFREFLRARGYKFAPQGWMVVRLVHLPDAEKRTELMLIYLEAHPPGTDFSRGIPDQDYNRMRDQALANAKSLVKITIPKS